MIIREYTISGKYLDSLGEASSDTKKNLKSLGVPPSIIKRAAVSMYEAEVNCAIHGGGGVGKTTITPNDITILFKDEGPGIPDIDQAMQEGFSTADEKIREMGFGAGMGLPNIKKNSDNLEIKSKAGEGTTIIIKLNLGNS